MKTFCYLVAILLHKCLCKVHMYVRICFSVKPFWSSNQIATLKSLPLKMKCKNVEDFSKIRLSFSTYRRFPKNDASMYNNCKKSEIPTVWPWKLRSRTSTIWLKFQCLISLVDMRMHAKNYLLSSSLKKDFVNNLKFRWVNLENKSQWHRYFS